ncbi:SGNH/GDSL hydrolase family protein [Sulfitobacter sp. LCG007]
MTFELRRLALAAAITLAAAAPAFAQDGNWVGTWTASAQPRWDSDFPVPIGMPGNFWNQTLRQVARVSIGGAAARIELSNEYGDHPVTISVASIALTDDGAAIDDGTAIPLSFGGAPLITIPPGAVVLSDAATLDIPALSEVSVSLFFEGVAPASTVHWDGHNTAYVAQGDQTAAADFPDDAISMTQRAFLTEIMVDAPEDTTAVIAFGDSITDGDGSSIDGNDRWPDVLARRLVEAGHSVAVQNQGISGAKVLSDRMGTNALARFERDVLSQDDATAVLVMIGINDIGWPGTGLAPDDTPVTADQIIAGHKQLIARAHANGLKVYGATLTPFRDSFAGTPFEGYWTEEKEAMRLAVNAFIRSGAYDGVVDFDKVVEDPATPGAILPAFDKGDHLHPNAAGYQAMGESIDLDMILN